MIYVIKKDGTREEFNSQKIVAAVNKSAARILYTFSDKEKEFICQFAEEHAEALGKNEIEIQEMHNIVEGALERVNPAVAKSYRDYRNYKLDFIHMMDDVYTKSQAIRYIGDKSNANTDSALVATKRSLIFNELNKNLYRKFFMTRDELQACKDGYIYIHDQSARLDTINCCLFRVGEVMKGGFEMGNVWYNEPNSLDTAFDVMGDIILSTAAQQYGGFTVPEVDKILAPYAQKSYDKYIQEFMKYSDESWTGREERAIEYALDKVRRDFDQGWQGIEYKLNTVGSSRGSSRRWQVFLFLKCIKADRVRQDARNRYSSRKSYSFMMKISMEKARSVRMYLRQGLTVLPRLCIRTGCPCQEKDIFPVCTSSMERL